MAAAIPDTRSEAEIEAACIAALEALRFYTWKLSQPRATKQSEGLPDFFFAGHGVTGWAEIKSATGMVRATQEDFRRFVTSNGGVVCLWRSEADALAFARGVMGTESEERAHG